MRATVRRSTLFRARNVAAPTNAEMLSTKCEVAVAMWIGRLNATIRNGTWMMPPPIPRILDMNPTKRLTTMPFQTSTR